MRRRRAFLLLLVLTGVKFQLKSQVTTIENKFFIPDSIVFKADSNLSQDRLFSYQPTLIFKDGCFYLFYANIGKPLGQDSLIFEYEPGYYFVKGWYKKLDSVNVSLHFAGREKRERKKRGKHPIELKIKDMNKGISFQLDNVTFVDTKLYTKSSKIKIQYYIDHIRPELIIQRSRMRH
jgi:hypothetical protein